MNVEGGGEAASPNEGGPSHAVLGAKPSLTYINQELWKKTNQPQGQMGKALAKHPDALTSSTDRMMTHMGHRRWKEVKQLVA